MGKEKNDEYMGKVRRNNVYMGERMNVRKWKDRMNKQQERWTMKRTE